VLIPAIFFGCVAWAIVGAIVVESARIWFGMWWLEAKPSTVALWPVIVIAALFGRNHDQ
jgi:hypothetical protein